MSNVPRIVNYQLTNYLMLNLTIPFLSYILKPSFIEYILDIGHYIMLLVKGLNIDEFFLRKKFFCFLSLVIVGFLYKNINFFVYN